ncbi:hypothetical protein CK203_094473 [Vitis vinifera]|uniref:Uncharacterized protein n=1 Tax=Vitis vinifera TaxID=29760 RepID=A0A438E9N6_VITVI|nr:hypothetical protein CK203_094473 [Vitis vinifera]
MELLPPFWGDIMLPVQAKPVILNIQFLVIEDLSPFNAIMERTWLHGMKSIPSIYHQMVSYLIEDGQINLYGSQLAAHQCYQVACESGFASDNEPPTEPTEKSNHFTYVSSLLELEEFQALERVLHQNKDVFAWTHSDMPRIHPSIASYRLNVMPSSRPVH